MLPQAMAMANKDIRGPILKDELRIDLVISMNRKDVLLFDLENGRSEMKAKIG